ncbi:hypothetical protein [Achromobacter insolitus]|uniref:hypothetical protein n=1 Tax=Achromobacter insolitus TaxID=217204 RepID=UPI0020A25630|nr:hypothetical protein [Achromobacter insolitus]MCP1404468.1 hypothetical protein [Achromobacter insolitus]
MSNSTNTPAPAQEALLTDDQIDRIRIRAEKDSRRFGRTVDIPIRADLLLGLLSKLRAPVAGEQENMIARVDAAMVEMQHIHPPLRRSECERLIRAALASAPVAGEACAWFTEDHLTDKSATTWDRTVAERWRAKGWPVQSLFAAPQASEAVRDAGHPVFAFLLGEGPLRGVEFGDRHPDERGAYWWRKDLRAALSAQPGAQRTGGSE